MTRLARDFFALTTEEKLRFHMSGGEGGFSISSHLQGEAMKDWRDVVLYPTYPVTMGLEKDALKNACVDMEQKIFVTYFPKRPKPDLALGMRHTDNGILQDQVSCLQVTRDNGKTWVRVPFVPGALVINLGDIGHQREVHDYRPSGDSNSSKLFINTFLFPAPHATVYPPISYEAITMRKLKDL
ncbi:hypothetical protein Bca52824_046555 [Brassica carinata]|uniref:Isopenicillin N synthase-like Fe(2+) 2OG dioxygenase domain-containing protein n=1 Tax=Brassica carinata TaxID=52824 RepID=A0A8X7UR91_BRACI|nr:hypothetical protein Bca52824_046555 [Brassica carinata]